MTVLLIKRSKHYSFVAFTSSQVSDMQLKIIESTVLDICATLPMFFSRLVPSHLFGVKNPHSRFPLTMLNNSAVLCVSGIGFPDAFFHAVREVIFFFFFRFPFCLNIFCIRSSTSGVQCLSQVSNQKDTCLSLMEYLHSFLIYCFFMVDDQLYFLYFFPTFVTSMLLRMEFH